MLNASCYPLGNSTNFYVTVNVSVTEVVLRDERLPDDASSGSTPIPLIIFRKSVGRGNCR